MSDYIRQHAVKIDYKLGESWIILNEIEQSIKKKIEAVGTPLKDWNIKINRGILTGLNEAFIISKEKRDELIKADPKSAEIIRPILRGRDIKRNKIDFQDIYIINSHNGYISEDGTRIPPININDYPAIKDWLDNGEWNTKPKKGSNYERLAKRTDKGITPYNLRSLAYMDDFSKPKIFWSDISTSSNFVLINDEIYINNTAYMITDIHPNAVYILNSRIMNWYFSKICSDLGNSSRYFKQYVELLPLPHNADIYNDLSSENTDSKLSAFYQFTSEEYKKIK
ncbi:TaqI-like C-terminal specificity domain-containing protein [Ligilactobacillus salivarius]